MLNGLYVITDNKLTPNKTILKQIEQSLKAGAKIVQLRDKKNSIETIEKLAISIQDLCKKYNALFVLNDEIELAIKLKCDALHIGKSDHHNFEKIRKEFKGIIGVSCYGNLSLAKEFELKGANYVAFGSFFSSPTKPQSTIVPFDVLTKAKESLSIPICAIGGINSENVNKLLKYKPDMIALISDIWSDDITKKTNFYNNILKGKEWKP